MPYSYTFGPWRYVETKDGYVGVEIDGGHQLMYDIEGSCPQCFSNMRLIATAPELFETLEELTNLMDDIVAGSYTPDSFTTQPAHIIMAKARGKQQWQPD